MKVILLPLLVVVGIGAAMAAPIQNEKPKTQEAKKPESSCDSYTEFKKKQKALKEKKVESSKETKK